MRRRRCKVNHSHGGKSQCNHVASLADGDDDDDDFVYVALRIRHKFRTYVHVYL